MDHWKECDAGHFASRGRLWTRYNEKNIHAQCRYCNRFCGGQQYKYGREIDTRYGRGTADVLMGTRTGYKISKSEYMEMIDEYKGKAKEEAYKKHQLI